MNTEKTAGTIKTQSWNIQKIEGGQITIGLKGNGSYRESTGYRTHRPGALSTPTAIGRAKQADFIKVLPI